MKTVPELSRTIGKRGTLGAEFVECKPRMVNGHLCFLNEQSTWELSQHREKHSENKSFIELNSFDNMINQVEGEA